MSGESVEFKSALDIQEGRETLSETIKVLLDELREWFREDKKDLNKARKIESGLENVLKRAKQHIKEDYGLYTLYYEADCQLGYLKECIRKIEEGTESK